MRFVIFIYLCCISLCAFAGECNQLFDQASEAYLNGQYQKSSMLYEQVKLDCGQSRELLMNLGHAYLKQDQVAKAKANYLRHIKYFGKTTEISKNLEFINKKNDLHTRAFSISNILSFLSLNQWAYLSIVLAIFTCLCFLGYLFYGNNSTQKYLFGSMLILFFFMLMSLVLGYTSKSMLFDDSNALIASKCNLYNTFKEGRNKIKNLKEGQQVNILDQNSGYVLIQIPDQSRGWVLLSKIEKY